MFICRQSKRNLTLAVIGVSAILLTLGLPASLRAQGWTWTTEIIFSTASRQASLAVDAEGNLHLSYSDDETQTVRYAFRSAQDKKWFTMLLGGKRGNTDTFTRVALDRAGNPYICYTPDILRYAHWDGTRWYDQVITDVGLIQYSCSVAIAADKTPNLIWYQYSTPEKVDYVHIKHASLKDGAWLARTLDFAAQTGKFEEITLDSDGNPHISYDAFVAGELRYAHYVNGQWKIATVDSRAMAKSGDYDIGMGNSIVLDKDGRPMISYYGDHNFKFARFDGERWKIETLEQVNPTGSWLGWRSHLLLDSRGLRHVSYEDGGLLKHAYWDGSQWKIQVVVPTGPEKHRYSAFAIGPDDTLYLVYRDPFDASLKLAVGRKTPAATSSASRGDTHP
jgi:hypothetical protein